MLLVLAIVCVACGGRKEGGDAYTQPEFNPEFSANYTPESSLKADTAYMHLSELNAANATYLALYYLNASGIDFERSQDFANRAVACYDAAVKADPALTEKLLADYNSLMSTAYTPAVIEALRNPGSMDRPAETVQTVTDTAPAAETVPEMTVEEGVEAAQNI